MAILGDGNACRQYRASIAPVLERHFDAPGVHAAASSWFETALRTTSSRCTRSAGPLISGSRTTARAPRLTLPRARAPVRSIAKARSVRRAYPVRAAGPIDVQIRAASPMPPADGHHCRCRRHRSRWDAAQTPESSSDRIPHGINVGAPAKIVITTKTCSDRGSVTAPGRDRTVAQWLYEKAGPHRVLTGPLTSRASRHRPQLMPLAHEARPRARSIRAEPGRGTTRDRPREKSPPCRYPRRRSDCCGRPRGQPVGILRSPAAIRDGAVAISTPGADSTRSTSSFTLARASRSSLPA